MARSVGVDGCRAGWIAVHGDGGEPQYAVYGKFRDLFAAHADADMVLVDIPIGLPWSKCPKRPCDISAREVLSSRRGSVFFAPCREAARLALQRCDGQSERAAAYRAANALNRQVLGSGLSQQAWGICRKIAEVDHFLLASPSTAGAIREMHPEICFQSLNLGRALQHGKKSRSGQEERLGILSKFQSASRGLLERVSRETFRKDVQADDVLDALAGYITASMSTERLDRLVGTPEEDEEGLPMEMVFARPPLP